MMKLLPLLLLLSAPARSADDPLAELDGLVARQKSESEAGCNKFRKKWRSVVKGGLNRDSASHVSKTQALDALKLLEKYPFPGAANEKAWEYFAENQATLAALPDQKAVYERFTELRPPCEVFSRAVHRELLLKDVAALQLTKKEKGKVAHEARSYLRRAGAGALAGLGMKLNLLVTYLGTAYDGENREAVKAKAAALLQDFESSRDRLTQEQQPLAAAGKAGTVEILGPELRLWSRIRGELKTLLDGLEED